MDPQLNTKLTAFSLAASAEDRAIRTLLNGNKQTLSLLNTIEKSNLVAAINEVLLLAGSPLEDVDVALQDYFVLHPQTFVYEQTVPDTTWNALHPLDHRPGAVITDSAGTVWISELSYPAANVVTARFNLPLAGKMTLF